MIDFRFQVFIGSHRLDLSLHSGGPLAETIGVAPGHLSCHTSLLDGFRVIFQGVNRPTKTFESVYTACLPFFIDETVHIALIRVFPNSSQASVRFLLAGMWTTIIGPGFIRGFF